MTMPCMIDGIELPADDQGYLLEPEHREHGQTPNLRQMLTQPAGKGGH
jgi:hypothetical protein